MVLTGISNINKKYTVVFITLSLFQIAQKLKEIGDKMEGSLPDEVKTQIEEQCSNIQLPSSMVYEQFSGVYRRFFESAKERIDNAWQKIYLVYHGKSKAAVHR